ncbi:MAG: YraN family protein [Verrucomicrobiales bacterium]|nr:YraN family protein [Verrucomicrobiales bacterium]
MRRLRLRWARLRERLRNWRQDAPFRRWTLRLITRLQAAPPVALFGIPLDRQEIGNLGEDLAARWLRTRRRRVLYRNYRGQHRGEVDLVCRHDHRLVFVEVKTRTSTAFGRPADAVNREKQRLILRGAQDWLRRLGHPPIPIRFDIVEVLLICGHPATFNVIEDAFQLPDSSLEGRTRWI